MINLTSALLTIIGTPVRCVDKYIGIEDDRLVFVHHPVELFTVVDIYKMPATVPRWQWRKVSCRVGGWRMLREHVAEPSLNQSGDRSAPSRCFFSKTLHYGVVDLKRRLHIDNHIMQTNGWELAGSAARLCRGCLVAHCGGSMAGSFVWSQILTDVASGWTNCAALLVRERRLVMEALDEIRKALPFPLRGVDTDNGTEFPPAISATKTVNLDSLRTLKIALDFLRQDSQRFFQRPQLLGTSSVERFDSAETVPPDLRRTSAVLPTGGMDRQHPLARLCERRDGTPWIMPPCGGAAILQGSLARLGQRDDRNRAEFDADGLAEPPSPSRLCLVPRGSCHLQIVTTPCDFHSVCPWPPGEDAAVDHQGLA